MTKTLLERITQQLEKEGLTAGSHRARQWLLHKTQGLRVSRQDLLKRTPQLRTHSAVGRMYHFFYNPKTYEKLSYWDKFPLVIPIESYADGFLGLNLHYLSPKMRLILLDKLSRFATTHAYDETTRLRLSYDMLRRSSSIAEFRPCLKRYLYPFIQSKFLHIEASEWDIACLLPSEFFRGASKERVFQDSEESY